MTISAEPMPLDAATVRNLELPALTQLLDRTATPVGARQLRSWVGAPLRDAEAIELRLAAVDGPVADPGLRQRAEAAHRRVQAVSGLGEISPLSCVRGASRTNCLFWPSIS